MEFEKVGVREAKANLSGILEKVKNGREIIITERGKPIGMIVPVKDSSLSLEERIKKLEKLGWLSPSKPVANVDIDLPIQVPEGLAQQYLQEDRDSL